MINIAIVEDEAMYAKQLQEFLLQYQKENGEVFNITVYSDGDQIVHKYKSQFDIILMDALSFSRVSIQAVHGKVLDDCSRLCKT